MSVSNKIHSVKNQAIASEVNNAVIKERVMKSSCPKIVIVGGGPEG